MKYLWLSFFLSFSASAGLEGHPLWLRLLHFEGGKSRMDSPHFFLSPEGRTNAKLELEATIKAFQEKQILEGDSWPLACSFVARYQFLKDQGIELPDYDCTDFKWWKENLKLKTVSMVFSSYYVGNPASIFGHTFLKLNQSENFESKLTDYAVTFSANVTDSIGFIYAAKGLLGMYQGLYSVDPYYLKINEYVHNESRDLWEYPLEMTSAEQDRLLAHLWEQMNKGWFWYWFIDENCSYQLLSLLDVAYGDTHLASQTPLVVLPADTLKILHRENKLGEGRIRPSLRKQVNYRFDIASKSEEKAYALDAQIAKKRFEQLRFNNKPEKRARLGEELKQLLVARLEYPLSSPELPQDWGEQMKKEDPLFSHAPRKLELDFGVQEGEVQSRLGVRLGLHSTTDQGRGLPWQSELVYGGVKIQYAEDKFKLYALEGVRVFSPHTWSPASFPWTWRVDFVAQRFLGLPDGLIPHLKGAMGKTLALSFDWSTYLMLGLDSYAHSALSKGYEFGPSLEWGSVYSGQYLRFHFKFLAMQSLEHSSPWFQGSGRIQTQFNQSLEVALEAQRVFKTPYEQLRNKDEIMVSLVKHF